VLSWLDKDCGVHGFVEAGGGFINAEELAIDEALDFTARLLRVAMGVELFLDVGALGPFPKEEIHLGLGAVFFEDQALLLDGKPDFFQSERFLGLMGAPLNSAARTGCTSGWELSHWMRRLFCSRLSRRWFSSRRIGLGRRPILLDRVITRTGYLD